MSENEDKQPEVKTDHVPQLQPRGRKRHRPYGDPERMVQRQALQIQQLNEQVQNLMNLLLNKSGDQPMAGLPPKPHTIYPPQGFEYEVTRIAQEEGISRPDVFVKVVPQRPDNPEEPDPRYCVFCSEGTYEKTLKKKGANLAELHGLDIPGNPDEQQMKQLLQAFRMHMAEIQGYEGSKKKHLRRLFADHFELRASKRGPVPDCVKFRTTGRRDQKDKEVAMTAAQANEFNLKKWEADCAAMARNQGR